MLSSKIRIGLWLVVTAVFAVGAIAVGNDRYADSNSALTLACTGAVHSRQLDNALFYARARSDSGADLICAPPQMDDDFDGAALSRSPSARAESQFGFFGNAPRRY